MVWQVGAKGHGAELMINIAIVSMHAILYIDILGPTFVMSEWPWPPWPPCSTAYACTCTRQQLNVFIVTDRVNLM